eukprot:CAMPEP_0206219380 /NCGR_PEP_ID=MMETSP0047_2-20121206/4288_1 /ASSEMBLY_ACC=CAM_ASM_000192 /TAXON_ID=195065 /ORGANISM="Chroomonas mesostigmatica_cf, Strain CCMP1168" /LENGTH=474 /DNA_ID=CAMNT_0053641919 /DNA_START=334 /DNA_END=1756 /DNA_ORIENTATION=+
MRALRAVGFDTKEVLGGVLQILVRGVPPHLHPELLGEEPAPPRVVRRVDRAGVGSAHRERAARGAARVACGVALGGAEGGSEGVRRDMRGHACVKRLTPPLVRCLVERPVLQPRPAELEVPEGPVQEAALFAQLLLLVVHQEGGQRIFLVVPSFALDHDMLPHCLPARQTRPHKIPDADLLMVPSEYTPDVEWWRPGRVSLKASTPVARWSKSSTRVVSTIATLDSLPRSSSHTSVTLLCAGEGSVDALRSPRPPPLSMAIRLTNLGPILRMYQSRCFALLSSSLSTYSVPSMNRTSAVSHSSAPRSSRCIRIPCFASAFLSTGPRYGCTSTRGAGRPGDRRTSPGFTCSCVFFLRMRSSLLTTGGVGDVSLSARAGTPCGGGVLAAHSALGFFIQRFRSLWCGDTRAPSTPSDCEVAGGPDEDSPPLLAGEPSEELALVERLVLALICDPRVASRMSEASSSSASPHTHGTSA